MHKVSIGFVFIISLMALNVYGSDSSTVTIANLTTSFTPYSASANMNSRENNINGTDCAGTGGERLTNFTSLFNLIGIGGVTAYIPEANGSTTLMIPYQGTYTITYYVSLCKNQGGDFTIPIYLYKNALATDVSSTPRSLNATVLQQSSLKVTGPSGWSSTSSNFIYTGYFNAGDTVWMALDSNTAAPGGDAVFGEGSINVVRIGY